MIPPQTTSSCRSVRPWPLAVVLMALVPACAPQETAKPGSEDLLVGVDTKGEVGGGADGGIGEGDSLVGRLDVGPVMPDAWDPAEAYREGLAESSDQDPPSTDESAASSTESIASEERPADQASVEIEVATSEVESTPLPLPLAKVDLALARLAAEADDPMVYEIVRSMLPILALEGVGADEPAFEPSTNDLLGEEIDMLEAVSEFAVAVRSDLSSGMAPKAILIERLSELLDRLRNESGLRMGRVELCTSIAGYGDVEVASRRMPTGRDQEILVYAELDGLDWVAKPNAKVGWEIRYRLQLHQMSDGMVIDPGVESGVSDTLVAPVKDNYLWIRYALPAKDLNAGRYVLKLWIREPSTNREDERSIEIDLLPERLLGRSVSLGGS